MLCSNSCFSTHFPLIFWWPFFCSPSFFPHFLLKCLNIYNYKYLSYLVSSTPSPPIIFRCRHGRKILGCTQQWAKIEIIGRDWGQILGGCIPHPPGFAALWVGEIVVVNLEHVVVPNCFGERVGQIFVVNLERVGLLSNYNYFCIGSLGTYSTNTSWHRRSLKRVLHSALN